MISTILFLWLLFQVEAPAWLYILVAIRAFGMAFKAGLESAQ